MRPRLLAVLACLAVLLAGAGASAPARATHWLSLINVTHEDPTGMEVVVVPPAFFSADAMVVQNRAWIGGNALALHPAVQATLEATEYWAWWLGQSSAEWPQLASVTYTTRVLGVDATLADLERADILIFTGMVTDPATFIFHLGLGLPTYPFQSFWFNEGGQRVCTVWNTGLGAEDDDMDPIRLRNLVLHEFGHCLGAGHTGASLGGHCSDEHGCFDHHPTDIMSKVFGTERQCLSNLNAQSIAEGYAWVAAGTGWEQHDGETFMEKTAYAQTCQPSGQRRF